jgi:hypothetical protein
MNREDTEALEIIKDYLRQNGLKSTLECLEKEESYKNVTDKKKDQITVDLEKTKLGKILSEQKDKSKGLSTAITSDNTDEMTIEKDIDASDNNDMIIDDLVASFDNNVSLKIPSHISFGRKHKKGFVRERERK